MKPIVAGLVVQPLASLAAETVKDILALKDWELSGPSGPREEGYRSCSRAFTRNEWLVQLIANLMRVPPQRIEPVQLTTYEVGDHFLWHMDRGEMIVSAISHRLASLTIQLTDSREYRGGNLEFCLGPEPHRASRALGSSVCFSAWIAHRVTPVTKGRRQSVVAWVR